MESWGQDEEVDGARTMGLYKECHDGRSLTRLFSRALGSLWKAVKLTVI